MNNKLLILSVAVCVLVVGAIGLGRSTHSPVTSESSCEGEFNSLYGRHKADLDDCSVPIRDGEFEGKLPEPKQNNVVLIFDASGSMAGLSQGERKIDIAKDAVRNFVNQLEGTDVHMSVVVYGHKGDNTVSNKTLSCGGIEELYTLGEAYGSKITSTLSRFEPTGWTPIAEALIKARDILTPYNSEKYNNSIVLISDGIETCGGDPARVVEEMNTKGFSVTTNVIGFDVDAETAQQLKAVAMNGRGEYFDARTRADLDFALSKHTSYMEKFDYRMRRVSENLTDINTATERHFACVQALEVERAHMLLDIYADGRVTNACQEKVDDLYTRYYEEARGSLTASFDRLIQSFEQKSQ